LFGCCSFLKNSGIFDIFKDAARDYIKERAILRDGCKLRVGNSLLFWGKGDIEKGT